MRHFTEGEWADFAKMAAPTEQQAAMQQHLDQGCQQCSSTLNIWTKVLEVASRESSYQPPESVVRRAKALYLPHQREKKLPVAEAVAQLLFDSFQQPLLAGVRGAGASVRQLLYGNGDFRVDLRMDPIPRSKRVSIVGQILNTAKLTEYMSNLGVVIQRGKNVLAQSTTNEFGEFHLELDAAKDLQLTIDVKENRPLVLPLPLEAEDGLP